MAETGNEIWRDAGEALRQISAKTPEMLDKALGWIASIVGISTGGDKGNNLGNSRDSSENRDYRPPSSESLTPTPTPKQEVARVQAELPEHVREIISNMQMSFAAPDASLAAGAAAGAAHQASNAIASSMQSISFADVGGFQAPSTPNLVGISRGQGAMMG